MCVQRNLYYTNLSKADNAISKIFAGQAARHEG